MTLRPFTMGFFTTIDTVIGRLGQISEKTAEIAEYEREELLSLRKDEILLGRNSDGEPFLPGYLHDPYFNDPKVKISAVQYANYKNRYEALHRARIEHPLIYPNKDPDTPNLRYTLEVWAPGENFQDSMYITISGKEITIGSTYRDAGSISSKYGGKVYDLGPGAKEYFWKWILAARLKRFLKYGVWM